MLDVRYTLYIAIYIRYFLICVLFYFNYLRDYSIELCFHRIYIGDDVFVFAPVIVRKEYKILINSL